MMVKVTVALFGDPADPWRTQESPPWETARYGDLPTVTLEVPEDATLASVLDRSVGQFDVAEVDGERFQPSWVAFYRPADEEGYAGRSDTSVTLVDADGRALWNVYFRDPKVTMAALLHAADMGVLDGDPTRPYLILEAGYGNGYLPSWTEMVQILRVMRKVLDASADVSADIGTVGGVSWGIAAWLGRIRRRLQRANRRGGKGAGALVARRVSERFRRTPDVVEEHSESWEERGAGPITLWRFIDARRDWNAELLARFLGTGREDAEALLRGLGYSFDEGVGLWRRAADGDGRTLRRIFEYRRVLEEEVTPEGLSSSRRSEFERRVVEELRACVADEDDVNE